MKPTTRYFNSKPRLSYTDSGGTGPILMLLHGVTRCGADWDPLLPGLSRSWRVLSLDQRGHGESERAESYLVSDFVLDATRFVTEEVAAPLVICGHSLGAMVAAAVAAEVPPFVRGVVLEDPPFQTMGNRIEGSPWHSLFVGMRKAAEQGRDVAETTDLLADIRLPMRDGHLQRLGELRDRPSLEWSATCLCQLDPEVLTPVIEGRWLDGYDVADVLSRIRCPNLLLQADPSAGGALTDDDANSIAAALPGNQHVRFPDAGHQLHRDNTEGVLGPLNQFLNSIRATSWRDG